MRTVGIIQARMGSSRLPGKVVAEVAGKPMIVTMVDRLERARRLDEIVVAIPSGKANDPLRDVLAENGICYHRGPENDVLTRVLEAAHEYGVELIVELTGDCPLVDPTIVDEVVGFWKGFNCDFATTTLDAGDTGYARGMDVRVFSTKVLEEVDRLVKWTGRSEARYREHVSLYVWEHPQRFRTRLCKAPSTRVSEGLRLTVDEPADLELVRKIFEAFAPRTGFSYEAILSLMKRRPELRTINDRVEQRRP